MALDTSSPVYVTGVAAGTAEGKGIQANRDRDKIAEVVQGLRDLATGLEAYFDGVVSQAAADSADANAAHQAALDADQ